MWGSSARVPARPGRDTFRAEVTHLDAEPALYGPDGLPLPGALVGAYVLERKLGQGGMASVFAARHKTLGKRVAIKMLLPHGTGEHDSARRFLREGETVAKLRHPHVVDVTDVGSDARGTPYLVMEYLEGEDLAALLERERPLSLTQTADLLVPVISAVAAAHDAGIIHRDLKPQNIYLARERGELVPKVLDFGISKLLGSSSMVLTRDGTMLGTPYYMSPEQTRGQQLDSRTDQFSLGVILYECVTGRMPFEGDSVFAVIAAIMFAEPPRFEGPASDPAFEALVRRALAKEPAARFPDVRALGRALIAFAGVRTRLAFGPEFGLDALPWPQAPATRGDPAQPPAPAPERHSEPALPPVRPARALALVGAAASALTLAVVLALRPGTSTRDEIRPPPDLPTPAPRPSAEPRAPAGTQATPAPPGSTALPTALPGAHRFTVTLSVEPRTAAIKLDGAVVAYGELRVDLDRDGTEHTLEASAPGFRAHTLRFRDAPPDAHALTLARISPAPRPKLAEGVRAAAVRLAQPEHEPPAPSPSPPPTAPGPSSEARPDPAPPKSQLGTNLAPIVR